MNELRPFENQDIFNQKPIVIYLVLMIIFEDKDINQRFQNYEPILKITIKILIECLIIKLQNQNYNIIIKD